MAFHPRASRLFWVWARFAGYSDERLQENLKAGMVLQRTELKSAPHELDAFHRGSSQKPAHTTTARGRDCVEPLGIPTRDVAPLGLFALG